VKEVKLRKGQNNFKIKMFFLLFFHSSFFNVKTSGTNSIG